MLQVSERAGVGEASYLFWERKHMHWCTRSQSEPTSAPHTAPIDEGATFAPVSPHQAAFYALEIAWRDAANEKTDTFKRGQARQAFLQDFPRRLLHLTTLREWKCKLDFCLFLFEHSIWSMYKVEPKGHREA